MEIYMNQAEYERMIKMCRYVYSAPPNTLEREKRLAEIGTEESSKLWDFYCGICSGRIKKPENTDKESVEKSMGYEDFLKALRSGNIDEIHKFRRNDPETYACYVEQTETSLGRKSPVITRDNKRLEEEKKKRSEIMAITDTRARHKAIYENMALFGR